MSIFEVSNKDKANATAEVLKRMFPKARLVIEEDEGAVYTEDMKFSYKNGSLRMIITCPVCCLEVHSRPIRRPADVCDESEMRTDKHDCIDV